MDVDDDVSIIIGGGALCSRAESEVMVPSRTCSMLQRLVRPPYLPFPQRYYAAVYQEYANVHQERGEKGGQLQT